MFILGNKYEMNAKVLKNSYHNSDGEKADDFPK